MDFYDQRKVPRNRAIFSLLHLSQSLNVHCCDKFRNINFYSKACLDFVSRQKNVRKRTMFALTHEINLSINNPNYKE